MQLQLPNSDGRRSLRLRRLTPPIARLSLSPLAGRLKSKLSRLGAPGPLLPGLSGPVRRHAEPNSAADRGVEPNSAANRVAESEAPSLGTTIEELRRKMHELLSRGSAAGEQLAPAAGLPLLPLSSLPFELLSRAEGTIHHRVERITSGTSLGRVSLDGASKACMGLLSLLALDPALAQLALRRTLFFDTETTGLGGAGTLAFLVGIAYFSASAELIFEQLLLTSPVQEPALLATLDDRLRDVDWLVSFNGKSFDWPLLLTRYAMNHRAAPASRMHLDLLHVARRLHKARLRRVQLKRLELEVLGFDRGPDIDGAEVGAVYGHFLRSGDARGLATVVEHNRWDVLTMVGLVGLYGEPFGQLAREDLPSLGRTLARAKDPVGAARAAAQAMEQGGGPDALRLSAELAAARGDRARALRDYEQLAAEVEDPKVRLALAKLYEHHVRLPGRALELVLKGTGERPIALERRKARLESKVARRAYLGAPNRRSPK